MSDLFRNHAILLKDKIRMTAYKEAIARVVRPGMVVADLGSGLGALSFMALEAGASRVYAIEADKETLKMARVAAARRPAAGKIKFIHGLSYNVSLPEKVDVVVSETLGNLGLNENIAAALFDARRRFLKKDGVIIPSGLEVYIAPVEDQRWNEDVEELKTFLPDDPRFELGIVSQDISREMFLAEPVRVFDVEMTPHPHPLPRGERGRGEGSLTAHASFPITRNGVFSGFAGWFKVNLTGDIGFSTAPDAPPTHWRQAFLALRRPEIVKAGNVIDISIFVRSDGVKSITEYEYRIKNSP